MISSMEICSGLLTLKKKINKAEKNSRYLLLFFFFNMDCKQIQFYRLDNSEMMVATEKNPNANAVNTENTNAK